VTYPADWLQLDLLVSTVWQLAMESARQHPEGVFLEVRSGLL